MRDERLVSGRTPAYIFFTKERMASEDFKNISFLDRTRLIAKEWNNLPEADKKVRFLVVAPALLPQPVTKKPYPPFRNTLIWLHKTTNALGKKRRLCMVLNI